MLSRSGRRFGWWLSALLVAGSATSSPAVEAVLVELRDGEAVWTLREPVSWTAPCGAVVQDKQVALVVTEVARRRVSSRLPQPEAGRRLRLGERVELALVEHQVASVVEPPAAAAPVARGTVVSVAGDEVKVAVSRAPVADQPARVEREGRGVGLVAWQKGDRHEWLGKWRDSGDRPRVGDTVLYPPSSQQVAAPAEAVANAAEVVRPVRPDVSQDRMIAGDAPIYDALAAFAARGYIPSATRRMFEGALETTYSRGQIADFLASMFRQLADDAHAWPVHSVRGLVAGQMASVLAQYRTDLKARGVDVQAVDRALAERGGAGWGGIATGLADARVRTGKDVATGRAEASLLGSRHSRLRFGLTLGTEGGEAFPPYRDRSDLAAYWAEYDLSRHLDFGFSRVSSRFGMGHHDLLWSDNAKPFDQIHLTYRAKAFGKPISIEQHLGIFGRDKAFYVTLRRYEYLPSRRLTLGLNFGLVTDSASQAAASWVMPLYAARFTVGPGRLGGRGNFLGSADASYRVHDDVALYGQFFADEFDFSTAQGRGLQRIGLLTGLRYTPQWAFPGTSYRIEGTIIPDRGTYVGQQDVGLAWRRDGILLGHPYGEDSAGLLFEAYHRLTRRVSATLGAEVFRQFRSYAVPLKTFSLNLGTTYDINAVAALGFGYTHDQYTNRRGVSGLNQTEDSLYVETRLGF